MKYAKCPDCRYVIEVTPSNFCYGCSQHVCLECAEKWHLGWGEPHRNPNAKRKRVVSKRRKK